jgi:hypothetical protein
VQKAGSKLSEIAMALEGHNVQDVATRRLRNNPALVLDFYNQRRKQLKEVP